MMKLLIDDTAANVAQRATEYPQLVRGQLITPRQRYTCGEGEFAIDNSAYSEFDAKSFKSLLRREKPHRERCLWVAVPDVVGNGRRTLEVFDLLSPGLMFWPLAFVAQDGIEDLQIPWEHFECLFIGGSTDWKMSQTVVDLLKTARILEKATHVGRISTPDRYRRFAGLADTCDGSALARYSENRFSAFARAVMHADKMPLFDQHDGDALGPCIPGLQRSGESPIADAPNPKNCG
jgi:hypothetical protein